MLDIGSAFAHYTIESLLGRGGMGEVYRALDTRLHRRVALKVLSAEADASARLMREARAAAALDHPNAVSVFDVGEHQQQLFIVMELVDGRTLRSVIDEGNAPAEARLAWLVDVARALAAAHGKGIVHRDIKPENVMVRSDGVVKVLDFGIARRKRPDADPGGPTLPALATITQNNLLLGTPLYMSPEQLRGAPVDGRSDQFSWAVLAFELLSGRPPWKGSDDVLAILASVLTDPPDQAASLAISDPPRSALLRALDKDPERRFPSMEALLSALLSPGLSPASGDGPARGPVAAGPGAAGPGAAGPGAAGPGAAGPGAAGPGVAAVWGERGSSPPASPRAQGTLSRLYSTAELKVILESAIERQAALEGQQGHYSFDDLLDAARELGIDETSLRVASSAIRQQDPASVVDYKAWMRRRWRAFYRHLGAFGAVNFFFVALGLLLAAKEKNAFPALLIPGLVWSIGVIIHGVVVYTSDEDEWRDRARRKQRKKARRDPELEQAAATLLEASKTRRLRVAPADPAPRVRAAAPAISPLAETDELAMAEAAEAAEAADRKKSRR